MTRVLYPGPRHVHDVPELLAVAGSHGGNLVTGARIAELAIAHRAAVHAADRDFQRFPGPDRRFPLVA